MEQNSEDKIVYRSSSRGSSTEKGQKYVYRKAERSDNDEMEDIAEESDFLALLKELLEVQASITKVDAQIAIRRGQEQIKAKIDSTRELLEAQAKRFGTNLKSVEAQYAKNSVDKKSILEQFEACLDEISEMYDPQLQEILAKKTELEAEEQAVMFDQKHTKVKIRSAKKVYNKRNEELKSEIKQAIDSGNLDLAQNKMDELKKCSVKNDYNALRIYNIALAYKRSELRKMIEQCEQEYDALINERDSKINGALDSRDNSLALIPKQNLLQKMVGSLLNRFNGSRRFIKNYMEPLQAKITDLRGRLPEIKETVAERGESFKDSVSQARERIGKVVDEKVFEYSSRLADFQLKATQKAIDYGYAISTTTRGILDNAKDIKTQFVENARKIGKSTIEVGKDIGMTVADNVVTAGKTVKDTAVRTGKTVLAVGGNIVQGVKDNVNLGISTGKQTYRSIIRKGYETKLSFIDNIQNRLNKKRDELNEKMQNLNPQDRENETPGMDLDD